MNERSLFMLEQKVDGMDLETRSAFSRWCAEWACAVTKRSLELRADGLHAGPFKRWGIPDADNAILRRYSSAAVESANLAFRAVRDGETWPARGGAIGAARAAIETFSAAVLLTQPQPSRISLDGGETFVLVENLTDEQIEDALDRGDFDPELRTKITRLTPREWLFSYCWLYQKKYGKPLTLESPRISFPFLFADGRQEIRRVDCRGGVPETWNVSEVLPPAELSKDPSAATNPTFRVRKFRRKIVATTKGQRIEFRETD